MSHFLKIRTQMKEREHVVQALRDLHYQFQEGQDLVVRGYAGNRERAKIVVNTQCAYDIGLRRAGEVYEAVADWDYGVAGNSPLRIEGQRIRQENFIQQIGRQYSYNLIHAYAKETVKVVESEEELANGDMIIVLADRG